MVFEIPSVCSDTPSRIVRERLFGGRYIAKIRYTLTYSEGTNAAGGVKEQQAIHPHV